MKFKNLSIVFGLLGLILFGFSSCSDDDDNDKPIDWGGITKTYTGANLKVNEVDTITGASIKIEGTSGETAKVILTNIVVGEPELGINTTLNRNGNNYTLEASNSNQDRDVSVKGTIVGDKMTATVTTKIKSPIVGTWALKDSLNDKNIRVADLIVRLKGLDFMEAIITQQLAQNGVSGEGLAKAVEYVDAYFNENGTLDIKFKDTKSGTEMSTSQLGLDFHYYTKVATNKAYIAINKDLFNQLLPLLNGIIGQEIDPARLAPLFEDAGNSYAIPLNYKNAGNYTQFYISKDYLAKVVLVADGLKLIPKDFEFVVEWLQDLNSEDNKDVVIDFGLGFNKK
jgi:hypothetical protein